jgi:hypothetical protein
VSAFLGAQGDIYSADRLGPIAAQIGQINDIMGSIAPNPTIRIPSVSHDLLAMANRYTDLEEATGISTEQLEEYSLAYGQDFENAGAIAALRIDLANTNQGATLQQRAANTKAAREAIATTLATIIEDSAGAGSNLSDESREQIHTYSMGIANSAIEGDLTEPELEELHRQNRYSVAMASSWAEDVELGGAGLASLQAYTGMVGADDYDPQSPAGYGEAITQMAEGMKDADFSPMLTREAERLQGMIDDNELRMDKFERGIYNYNLIPGVMETRKALGLEDDYKFASYITRNGKEGFNGAVSYINNQGYDPATMSPALAGAYVARYLSPKDDAEEILASIADDPLQDSSILPSLVDTDQAVKLSGKPRRMRRQLARRGKAEAKQYREDLAKDPTQARQEARLFRDDSDALPTQSRPAETPEETPASEEAPASESAPSSGSTRQESRQVEEIPEAQTLDTSDLTTSAEQRRIQTQQAVAARFAGSGSFDLSDGSPVSRIAADLLAGRSLSPYVLSSHTAPETEATAPEPPDTPGGTPILGGFVSNPPPAQTRPSSINPPIQMGRSRTELMAEYFDSPERDMDEIR